jgi:hypothetical protein
MRFQQRALMMEQQQGHLPERRHAIRLDASIPLTIRLIGGSQFSPPITVETGNISSEGLSISIRIQTMREHGRLTIPGGDSSLKLVHYLWLDNKSMIVGINILPQGRSIQAIGRVKWYARRLQGDRYDVKAGLLMEWMEREHRGEWKEYLSAVYEFMKCLGYGNWGGEHSVSGVGTPRYL